MVRSARASTHGPAAPPESGRGRRRVELPTHLAARVHGRVHVGVDLPHAEPQRRAAQASRARYAAALRAAGRSAAITTEIRPAPPFYSAEASHQQYCELNPTGYCGHGGTGVPLKAR